MAMTIYKVKNDRTAIMRQITFSQIITFFALLLLALVFGISTTLFSFGSLPLQDFRGVVLTLTAIFFVYLYAFAVYRIFLFLMPLSEGEIVAGTRENFVAQVNILFYLILFNSLIRTHFLPLPLTRFIYLALGAKLGQNTYSAGTILDPPLTVIGKNCIIGHDAVLFSHAIEGNRFSLSPIRIGDNVTISSTAVVMSGVTIDDDAVVAAGAVVTKGTHIGRGETWGGVPARRLAANQSATSG
jgi:acetyltransferase-like isoleucine patch superfamily enzyme